jgi:hypothetical protein
MGREDDLSGMPEASTDTGIEAAPRARVALAGLVVALADVGTRLLGRRLNPSPTVPSAAEHAQRAQEAQEIKERYADDEQGRNAALMRHYAEHRVDVTVHIWPVAAFGAGSVLVNHWVRSRLAPTAVVARGSVSGRRRLTTRRSAR